MSAIAIFRLSCCGREIAFGRFAGHDMSSVSKKECPFGCPAKKGLRKRPERVPLEFVRYEFDDTISPELLRTWKRGHSTGDLWKKYETARQGRYTNMKMNIKKLNGDYLKTELPSQFVPFRSGLAGQSEKHAEGLQSWLGENMSLNCAYLGVQDGTVYLDERVQR